jgi:biotin carboxyl carrier protein
MSEQKYEDFSLQINGAVYRTLFTKKYRDKGAWEKANPKVMKAFIPGTIREVNVKAGASVKEGEQLLILEAMKMENPILAPFAGTIKTVNVKVGEVVPNRHILIEME